MTRSAPTTALAASVWYSVPNPSSSASASASALLSKMDMALASSPLATERAMDEPISPIPIRVIFSNILVSILFHALQHVHELGHILFAANGDPKCMWQSVRHHFAHN